MGEDRKFPIAYIGEEFTDCAIHYTVLKVSTNYFTGEYVYRIRCDYPWGEVDEDWYDETRARDMKGITR